MPISAVEPLYQNFPMEFRRKLWTREECAAMEDAGFLEPGRYELIGGELLERMGKKRPHGIALNKIQYWLADLFGPDYVQSEMPIDVSAQDNPVNEPEPDILVLNRPMTEYREGNIPPTELRLLVEVADATLLFDLRTKAAIYSRAGIAEYWVVDIPNRRIVVHRQPSGSRYQSVIAYLEHESVAPEAAPEALFEVRRAFLPQSSEA